MKKKLLRRFVGVLTLAMAISWSGANAFADTGPRPGRLIKEVRHELLLLPYYGVFDHLEFAVNDDSVELHGAVTRPTLKYEAENVVKRIEGVRNVKNNIEVLPLSTMDDQIRFALFRAIYGDSALITRYGYRAHPSIHIIVRNGHILLEGVVANSFDRNLVNVRANGVPGVFSVSNNLQIDTQTS
jgi:hyperosmotically inducible protein